MNTSQIKIFLCVLCLLVFCKLPFAQSWNFRLNGKVEIRSWKLSSVAYKAAAPVNGASVKLYKGSNVISESASDANGNFQLNIPPEGDYTLVIESAGSDSKKFAVSTRSVSNPGDVNSKPSISIVGMMVTNYAENTKYLGLDQGHVIIEHDRTSSGPGGKESQRNYNYKLNMYDAEYLMIQRFCTANKLGDMALAKKNYELAEKFYLMAMDRMPGEAYPKERLKLVGEGLKTETTPKAIVRKKTETKTPSKQVIVSNPTQNTEVQKSNQGGKSRHKTRMVLGK